MSALTASLLGDSRPTVAPALRLLRPNDPRLVVVMPALNEERTIGDVIRRIPRSIPGIESVVVVVVNDGSTDRTAEIARREGVVVVSHPRPWGVGAAFQTGLRQVFQLGGDVVLSIDADGQFAPEDIPKVIAPILRGEADFATASRFADPALVPDMPWLKRWGNRQVSRLVSGLVGARYYDVSCGMRAYGKHAALSLSLLEPFTYTHEVFLHLSSKRMKIVEVPIAVRGKREFGTSRVAGNLFRYGRNALKIIFRSYRDYYPLKFFGSLAAVCLALGLPLLGFCLFHYLRTGSFSPHKWAGFVGSGMSFAAIVFLLMGVLGDMLNRQRIYLEEILYHARSLIAQGNRRDH